MKIRVENIRQSTTPPVRCFCSVVIQTDSGTDLFVIYDTRLVDYQGRRFVGMPSEIGKDGKRYRTIRILSQTVEDEILKAVEAEYAKLESVQETIEL